MKLMQGMFRIVFAILLCFLTEQLPAQVKAVQQNSGADTLEVIFHKDDWAIPHLVKSGETLFALSTMYHVPPAILTDANDMSYQSKITPGTTVYIPFGAYNQAKNVSKNRVDVRPLKYKVRKYDNLYRLAHLAGVQQKKMQQWNGMSDNYIEEGMVLFVGWVLYSDVKQDATAGSNNTPANKRYERISQNDPNVTIIRIPAKDTTPEIQKKYNLQTRDELVVTEEKGSAVFFENKGKLSATNTFFAFHNTAKPGTIIKVYNPGTDKTVFVKVLGPIPNTKMYHNSVIGISNGAKKALLVEEDKTWCELKYAP